MIPIEDRLLKKFALELVKIGAERLLSDVGSVQRLSVSFPEVMVSLPTSRWTLLRLRVAMLFVVVFERVTLSVVPVSWMTFAASLKVLGLNEMPATPVASVLSTSTENHTVPLIGASSGQPLSRTALNVPKSFPGFAPDCGRL